jgi:hypothetical protein
LKVSFAGEETYDEKYQQLEAKLKTTTDPIRKAKVLIKILELHLQAAVDLAKKGEFIQADVSLSRYRETIRQTQETLKSSGRNAQKKPAGFKDFELVLRKQLRTLEDLSGLYAYEQAKMVSESITDAKAAQEYMLLQIFGEENFGARKETKNGKPAQNKE